MKTIEYRFDKSHLDPDGPWQEEPDKKQWQDKATGLPCLIVRGPVGALCGYVGVPQEHPDHENDYDNVEVDVHGGLTFAGFCAPGEPEEGICHKIEPGDAEKIFWFGFDCAHWQDLTPGQASYVGKSATYRTFSWVEAEVTRLAKQLSELRCAPN